MPDFMRKSALGYIKKEEEPKMSDEELKYTGFQVRSFKKNGAPRRT